MYTSVQRCTLLALALALSGCASKPPEATIIYRTQEVKIPVPVKRECPGNVCHAFKPSCPMPVFSGTTELAALSTDDQKRLRCLMLDLKNWGNGMLAFALSP